MGRPTSSSLTFPILHLLLFGTSIVIVYASSSRTPSAIPFPPKEDLEYLTSEEEERLIYGGDESVIEKRISDLPEGLMSPPNPSDLPVPTMDPPLPAGSRLRKKAKKSNRGFPFRIPRVFLKNGAKILSPLKRKPRTRAGEMPIPSYRSRPSTLISSDPDQLEVAFKRVEIMASRAGLNMSSMPRRTQMQVLKRLVPKLPPRLSNMVRKAMVENSEKMYEYLPHPMSDPFVDETPQSSGYAGSFTVGDDFDDVFSGESQVHPVKAPAFDASKISIAHEESHEHFPSENPEGDDDDKGVPSFDLIPPSELHDDLHDFGSHTYSHDSDSTHKGYGKENPSYQNKYGFPEALASEALPIVMSAGSWNRSSKSLNSMKYNSTSSTYRGSLPTKDKFVQIQSKSTSRPIRVSIISKDRIAVNRSSDPMVKVIHIEPVIRDEGQEEVTAIVEEVKSEHNEATTDSSLADVAEKLKQQQLIRVKEISKDVIKAEEDKYKLSQMRQRSRTSTTSTSTARSITTTMRMTTTASPMTTVVSTTTVRPDTKETTNNNSGLSPDIILKLDNYDDNYWSESINYDDEEENWADQYDLTDEEIAATVAELKKYEEQSSLDNSVEQEYPWRLTPHPLEYPDHPDHPKDSPEESKPEKEKKPENGGPSQLNNGNNNPPHRPLPEHIRRPGFGPRRPPFMRRPPFRRPVHIRRPLPRLPMKMRPPMRINDVTVSEIPKEFRKECDYFSDNLCLVVQDYPIEAISEAIEQHPDIASVLIKEPDGERSWVDGVSRTHEHNYNFKHYFGQRRNDEETTSHKHRDFAGEGGFLCPSKVAYGQVKKAKSSSTGDWKYVVNFGEHTQTLRLEKCLSPGNTCSYVMPHYRTACTQVHNYHRLLAWDPEKGLHMDVFKIPTCCTCHVQGYYIPQQAHSLGFTHARRRDLPPKLKFTPPGPPRPPMPREAKKVGPPSLLSPVPKSRIPNQPPAIVVTDVSSKPDDKTKEHAISSSAKELKDDLHDLLSQYSALRERIAKKKNENILVSYSTSVSNSTDSLKPKTRESRNPTKLKPLLQLKKLQLLTMKKLNTTKDGKLKRPLARARAMLLARLNNKLKSSRRGRGRAMRHQLLNRLGSAGGGNGQGGTEGNGNGPMSMENIKSRIQLLRNRLNKYNERTNKRHPQSSSSSEDRLRERIVNSASQISNSNNNVNNRSSPNQRLRISSNRPSKVNYSYHPIMDYFNGKARLNSS